MAHRLRHAGDGIGARWRELSFYLLEMKERELYLVHGYRNTQHFAEAQLDLEARRCNELIRAEELLRKFTDVDHAFRIGRLSWSRVLILLRVVNEATQGIWIDFAADHKCGELREEVAGRKPGQVPGDDERFGTPQRRHSIRGKVSDADWLKFEILRAEREATGRSASDADILHDLLTERWKADDRRDPEQPADEETLPMDERNHDEVPAEARSEVPAATTSHSVLSTAP